jgi:peptidoglycan/xylan/chitin deacetylase (PgdA/CDA1 family)
MRSELRSAAMFSTLRIGFALALVFGTGSAHAECPGKPDAIGTSRILTIDPSEYSQIGTINYEESLPLRDHELVLTFDDGPSSPHTDKVLDALAAECVKATFFIVGEMAREAPDLVRRAYSEGHSIGTHTQTHPHLPNVSFRKAKKEIQDGIDSTIAALGDPKALSPFFRAPYLEITDPLEHYLASRKIAIWSIDFQADDWEPISSDQVVALALKRIEVTHKGILLLHDAEPRTPAALVKLLRELKVRGYKIVHVVAATATKTTSTSPDAIGRSFATRHRPAISNSQVSSPEPKGEEAAGEKSSAKTLPSGAVVAETTERPDRTAAQANLSGAGPCKGNSSAIGTSRVIVADPLKAHKIGTLQFSDTLPLEDHEVVLTFDDGPLFPETDKVLDTLAAECVKATFFVVGTMVQESPDSLRRAYAEGHTIGTGSESHPHLVKLPLKQAEQEISKGIATVAAALPARGAVAPFFRAPYLETTNALDAYLASQHLMLWSIDAQADDWQNINPDQVVERAITSIEKKRRGILMLYDTEPQTVAALPKLLHELKTRGYRVVHVEPPSGTIPKP